MPERAIDLATARVVSAPWWRRAWARIWGADPDRIALLLHEQQILRGIVKRQNAMLVELNDENQELLRKLRTFTGPVLDRPRPVEVSMPGPGMSVRR